jgi:hypothetical protein
VKDGLDASGDQERWAGRPAIPVFNMPHLPMMQPVVQAVIDQDAFAVIDVARLEWIKFESKSPAAVMAEHVRWGRPDYVNIHLDHVPVSTRTVSRWTTWRSWPAWRARPSPRQRRALRRWCGLSAPTSQIRGCAS